MDDSTMEKHVVSPDAHVLSPDSPQASIEKDHEKDAKEVMAHTRYGGIPPQMRKIHDPDVTFEEYHYYALRTREEQRDLDKPKTVWSALLTGKVQHKEHGQQVNRNLAKEEERLQITDEEWTNASRAFRTAGMGAVFYLITTDILGPFAVPFSIGTLGFGPGIALFTVFGFFAGYSGYLIWRVFMGVDSHEFPARNYGDLAFRTWGTIARHTVNFLQALALLLLLGQVTILFGGNIFAMSKENLCYVVCPLIYVIIGFFLGQIRTLRNYGFIATFAIWLNLLTIFITMGVIAHTGVNYKLTASSVGADINPLNPISVTPIKGVYPPIEHYAGLPTKSLVGSINGLLNGVLAYAGAQLFVEFMAEMRRPRDFLKAVWGAQLFIYTVYVVYGSFVYYYQGQYTVNPSYNGIASYGWQTAANTLTVIAGLIAGGLYGNIGIKVFYNNICCDLFNAPLISSRGGKIMYALIVPFWWTLAFLIAAAIPAYFEFIAIISASCLLNLTYTIPPWLALGYQLKLGSIEEAEGDGFDPTTGEVRRRGGKWARMARGFWKGGKIRVGQNIGHSLYFLASLSMCGLGMYTSVEGMIDAFKNPQQTSFSCNQPAIP